MRLLHLAASLTLALLAVGRMIDGSTSVGIATPTPLKPPDLAALTLRPSDLGEPGWAHEGAFVQPLADQARDHADYLGPEATSDEVLTVLTDAGWERQYVSIMSRAPSSDPAEPSARIRSYVTRYASPGGAAAGFAYLEDERSVATATDIPTTRPHGEASELTQERGAAEGDGPAFVSLDLTFRVGSLVAGVTVIDAGSDDRLGLDQDVVERLASRIEERIASSADGAVRLGTHVIRLVSDGHEIVTLDDAYYRIAAEDVLLAGEPSRGARLRTATYAGARDVYQLWQGIDTTKEAGVLYGVTLLRFQDETGAESWVTDLESILAENPFYGDLQFVAGAGGQELGDDAMALSYVANGGGGDAPRAMLVAVRVGADVARVHLVPQGALPSIPLDPVVELARQQATCLHEQACPSIIQIPTVLSDLLNEASPPIASPMSAEVTGSVRRVRSHGRVPNASRLPGSGWPHDT